MRLWPCKLSKTSPDSKVHGANMGPPGSCRPQLGPMLAPWTLLWGSSPQQLCALWGQHRHKLDIGCLDVWVIHRMDNSIHRKHEDALIQVDRCRYKQLSVDIDILHVSMQSVFMCLGPWNELILGQLVYFFQSVIWFCNIIHYKWFGTILVQYKGPFIRHYCGYR